MRTGRERLIFGSGLLFISSVAFHACAPKPSAPADSSGIVPVGTVRDVMENIVEPSADVLFDAVSVDVSSTATIDHRPTTAAEWEVVQHSAWMLVEATNLIKMPRLIAKPGDENSKSDANAPELTPAQIKTKKDADPALWLKYANGLRDASLKALDAANAKNADALFQVGDGIDTACENCHLEYWYPADKKTVLEDEKKRATPGPGTPPKK